MRTLRSILLLLTLAVCASAQDIVRIRLRPGIIAGNTYRNTSIGLSYDFPEGWSAEVTKLEPDPPPERVKELQLNYRELFQTRPTGRAVLKTSITIDADTVYDPKLKAPDAFVRGELREPNINLNGKSLKKVLARPAYEVYLEGRPFFRGDYKQVAADGSIYSFESIVAGNINGFMIVFTLSAEGEPELNELAETLDSVRFSPADTPDDTPPPPVIVHENPDAVKRITITESAARARVRAKVEPEYPAEARDRGVEGEVLIAVIVGADGNVAEASVISGHPLLNDAALDAVKQWKFEPVQVDGAPVETETKIRMRFSLISAKQKS